MGLLSLLETNMPNGFPLRKGKHSLPVNARNISMEKKGDTEKGVYKHLLWGQLQMGTVTRSGESLTKYKCSIIQTEQNTNETKYKHDKMQMF